ncbi:MAG TPA: hypothetical protein VL361_29705 [Candidatus Limnocylindrales bacterium]|nr:hypothetical protein [Candidatus Limnocylindrales bacterium]
MQRRTLKNIRAKSTAAYHHNVYVVLLDKTVAKIGAVRLANPNRDPSKPCVYVGMSGLKPEERFTNHKQGIKAAWIVKKHGIRLLPELYAHLNPMPYAAAAQMEQDLAEDLRRAGYTVTGGH